jgi:fatty-acyl-CoA synthase
MIINSKDFPSLKHVILLSDTKHKGMLNLEEDILKPTTSLPLSDMLRREETLSFEDVVNIQFTSGTTGFPKGVTLTHHGILNNA